MKTINVQLRLGLRPHFVYYDLFDLPSKGVEYKTDNFLRYPFPKEKVSALHHIKLKLWNVYKKFSAPAINIRQKENIDLIYSTNGILLKNRFPWMFDVENAWALFEYNPRLAKKQPYVKRIAKILKSDYCRKIIPWSNAGTQTIHNVFRDREIDAKTETLYIPRKSIEAPQKKNKKVPTILFVGRRYYEKGTDTVLKVYDLLDKKYDFKMNVVCEFPPEIEKKYSGRKNLNLIHAPDPKIADRYKEADIFLYPTNLDSYGMALLDAMNNRLPIVTTDVFAIPEIVKDRKTGFVIKHPMRYHDDNFESNYDSFDDYVKLLKTMDEPGFYREIAEKTGKLIESFALRKKMGNTGKREIERGKFSIEERNRKLYRIYKEIAFSER